jgi:hypothetical protein
LLSLVTAGNHGEVVEKYAEEVWIWTEVFVVDLNVARTKATGE